MAFVAMSDSMFAKSRQAIQRAIVESADQTLYAVQTNRTAAAAIPTQTVSRPVRVTLGSEARAWTVAVTVTEIAQVSVAGTSVAATDDL